MLSTSGSPDDAGTPRGSSTSATAMPPRDDGRRPSYRRTLRNRPFFFLWLAEMVSQSGDYIFEVALLWLVLELTHSAFAVAIIAAGTILPGVILGPLLGVYIDRWNRRRTLIVTNIVQGLVIAGLSGVVIAGQANLTVLFAIVLMLGSGATTVRVATNAYVPSVVPVVDLPPANGLLSLSGSLNRDRRVRAGGRVRRPAGCDHPHRVRCIVLLCRRRPAPIDTPSERRNGARSPFEPPPISIGTGGRFRLHPHGTGSWSKSSSSESP